MEKVISERFVAVYDYKDGETGFLGCDSLAGYRPYFTYTPAYKYLRDEPMSALDDANMIRDTMRTFNGNDRVDFDTVRVVRYLTVIEDVTNLEE